MKKVLIIGNTNSCRSIMAQALINTFLDDIKAYSCGVNATGKVDAKTRDLLVSEAIWSTSYASKKFNTLKDVTFDLVITLGKEAKQQSPSFPKETAIMHIDIEIPSRKSSDILHQIYTNIAQELLPKIRDHFIP